MTTCRVSQSKLPIEQMSYEHSRERRGFGIIAGSLILSAALLCAAPTAQAQSQTSQPNDVSSIAASEAIASGTAAPLAKNFPAMGEAMAAADADAVSELQMPPSQTPSNPTQRQIEREARKLRAGVRAGVALDPELIMLGAQAQFGPIFRSNISFRPSLEFGIGEVTAMFGFNGEFIYSMPMSSAEDRWAPYFGGGLGINLIHQHFQNEENGKRIDFGDFHSDSALNVLGGVRNRSGVFLELRTSVYSSPSPTLRLMVGYNF